MFLRRFTPPVFLLALCLLASACEPRDAAQRRRERAAREAERAVEPPTPKSDSELAEEGRLHAELERRAAVATTLRKSLGRTPKEVAALPPLALPEPRQLPPTTATPEQQRALLLKSARTAWRFVSTNVAASGFVGATDAYPYATVWDLASTLAATYSARELGLITPAQYRTAMDRALGSLHTMPRYDSTAFNKMYAVGSARMVDRKERVSRDGYGWSALDHGRMLVWLRIVGTDTAYTARTQAIVARLRLDRLIVDGYLRGQDLNPRWGQPLIARNRVYGEGRIGYEQYAAEGYALWGARAPMALDFAANARPVDLLGHTILADVRGTDALTSEPFIMMGLELGWKTPHWRSLSLSMLAAQEAHSRATSRITLVSEDAVNDPPWYFYYYLLYRDGKPFIVTSPLGHVSPNFPRWVSTKAAFGYHALAPGDFTWRALQAVQPSGASGGGWTAGVYEGSLRPTRSFNLNTAAVVLESAAYVLRGGCPLIKRCVRK
jgi:Protein of unknown function (DUF3131)